MFRKILVALDLEHESRARLCLETAFRAGGEEALYQLLSVVPPLGGSMIASFLPRGYDRQLLAKWQKALHHFSEPYAAQHRLQHLIAHGNSYEEIERIAAEEQCDLIVMAAGRRGALGATATHVLRDSRIPVLMARSATH